MIPDKFFQFQKCDLCPLGVANKTENRGRVLGCSNKGTPCLRQRLHNVLIEQSHGAAGIAMETTCVHTLSGIEKSSLKLEHFNIHVYTCAMEAILKQDRARKNAQ